MSPNTNKAYAQWFCDPEEDPTPDPTPADVISYTQRVSDRADVPVSGDDTAYAQWFCDPEEDPTPDDLLAFATMAHTSTETGI